MGGKQQTYCLAILRYTKASELGSRRRRQRRVLGGAVRRRHTKSGSICKAPLRCHDNIIICSLLRFAGGWRLIFGGSFSQSLGHEGENQNGNQGEKHGGHQTRHVVKFLHHNLTNVIGQGSPKTKG